MTLRLLQRKENDYRTNFWFLTRNESVDRMKNADLSGKKKTFFIRKLLFIIVVPNNKSETVAE